MSYSVKKTTITLTRGDTCRVKVDITDSDGEPYVPAEGDTIKFTVKKTYNDTTPLISKEISTETFILTIDPADTKPLDYGSYVYDIELERANGDVDTFITKSELRITEEVS